MSDRKQRISCEFFPPKTEAGKTRLLNEVTPALQDALVNGLAKRVFEEHDAPLRTESCLIAKPLAMVA